MRLLLIVLTSIALTSCGSRWPKDGTGGFSISNESRNEGGVPHEQILELEQRLIRSDKCGAKSFAALEFRDAEVQLIYLKRSHYAGDFTFAQREYNKLNSLLTIINHRLPRSCKV